MKGTYSYAPFCSPFTISFEAHLENAMNLGHPVVGSAAAHSYCLSCLMVRINGIHCIYHWR